MLEDEYRCDDENAKKKKKESRQLGENDCKIKDYAKKKQEDKRKTKVQTAESELFKHIIYSNKAIITTVGTFLSIPFVT